MTVTVHRVLWIEITGAPEEILAAVDFLIADGTPQPDLAFAGGSMPGSWAGGFYQDEGFRFLSWLHGQPNSTIAIHDTFPLVVEDNDDAEGPGADGLDLGGEDVDSGFVGDADPPMAPSVPP